MKEYKKQIDILRHLIEYEGDDLYLTRISNTQYRIGYCCNCGKCCNSLSIISRVSHNTKELVKLHGIDVKIIKGIITDPGQEPTEFSAELTLPLPCKNLIVSSDGSSRCSDYKGRPAVCKMYPRNNVPYLECTYTFCNVKVTNWFIEEHKKYWENKDGQAREIKYEG